MGHGIKVALVAVVLGSIACAFTNAVAGPEPTPFRLEIEFTADQIRVNSLEQRPWSVGHTAAPGYTHTCYVSPGAISTSLQGFEALPYCFVVEFGATGIRLRSIAGTNWTSLEYSCGGSTPCRIVVTENWVSGN